MTGITVRELIEALNKLGPEAADLPTETEGCDCESECIGVEIIERKDGRRHVRLASGNLGNW